MDIELAPEDRYARLRLIPWWDQCKLREAVVMVVGAGAIGNEILKNLALLGVGTILIVDMDDIENANLSRSVLFRQEDEGCSKAVTAARRVKAINPDVAAIPLEGSVITDVGTGVFRHVNLVLGGLDNREARLVINQKCWKTNTPWIDGAIEVFQGFARVFIPPDSACYECTMNEADYRQLNFRKSCTLLNRKEMMEGKVPTTPTTASVIAGIQVQEAVKLLHPNQELHPLKGQGVVFNGLTHDSYRVTYPRKETCFSHETWQPVIEINQRTDEITLRQLSETGASHLSGRGVLESALEMVLEGDCACGRQQSFFRPLITVDEAEVFCPDCGQELQLHLSHRFTGQEFFADRTLDSLGFAPGEIFPYRVGVHTVYLEMSGDIDDLFRLGKGNRG